MPKGDRVAEVWAYQADLSWSCGSGYLISTKKLITATHVLAKTSVPTENTRIKVRFTDSERLWRCQLRWYSDKDDADVALIEIVDEGWSGRTGVSVRWGILACEQIQVLCEASGYPDVLEDPAEMRDVEQASGSINPGSGVKGYRYHVQVHNAPVPTRLGKLSWAGMSGAALFAGEFLVGVVVEDAVGFDGRRLLASRLEPVFGSAEFRAALLDDNAEMVVEPVELAPLFSPPGRRHRHNSPAALLRADAETVRWLAYRDRDLMRLIDWCRDDSEVFGTKLVIGRGGLGKTRLARQLAVTMRGQGWICGMVSAEDMKNLPVEPLARLYSCVRPLLLIVDYAETRPDVVRKLIECFDLNNVATVRILMLARSAGQWWGQLTEHSTLMQDAIDPMQVHPLTPLPPDAATRELAFRDGAADLATKLAEITGLTEVDWSGLVPNLTVPDLSDQRYESIMRVHLSALVGLLQTGPTREAAAEGADPERVLMTHERKYWRRSALALGLGDLTDNTLTNAVTVSTLLGAPDISQSWALLGRIKGLKGADENRLDTVHTWLSTLYPSPAQGVWGQLEPDRLGEYLVGVHLLHFPDLLDEPFGAAGPEQLHQAFHVLARASLDHPSVGSLLERFIAENLGRYGPIALRVATETEMPDRLVAALEKGVDNELARSGAQVLHSLIRALPVGVPAFGPLGDRVIRLVIRVYDKLQSETGTDYRAQRAEAWRRLSDHLEENQDHPGAREAQAVAVQLLRELSGKWQEGEDGSDG
ncbi:hypothetical protein AB0M12_42350 [Nocardia vinacea]|uniref:hypothetical protein n=1 Tax=Nocardia vinacea TaxID=96468 RepID=UPI003426BD75